MTREVPYPTTPPADLVAAAEAVARTGKPRVIRALGKPLDIVPHQPKDRRVHATTAEKPRRSKRFSLTDPLWQVAGIAAEAGPEDVSANKDRYLAEAYANHE